MQRCIELVIAKSNEKWMTNQGAYEVGKQQYKYIVMMHIMFLISLCTEVLYFGREPASWWWIPFSLFVGAQIVRFWSLSSLGRFWNTRIIILPNAEVVTKGPYRFIRHPNYVIVAIEILTLPLLFQAYFTAILFSIVNTFLLMVRIQQEEAALAASTNYQDEFAFKGKFVPLLKKIGREE